MPFAPVADVCLSPFIDLNLDRRAPNSHGTRLIEELLTKAVSPVKPCKSSRQTTQSRLNFSNKRSELELPSKRARTAGLKKKPPVRRSTRRAKAQKVDIKSEEVSSKTIQERTEGEGNSSSDQSSFPSPCRMKTRHQTRAGTIVKREKNGKNTKKPTAAICSNGNSFKFDSGPRSRSPWCFSYHTTPCVVVLDGSMNNPVKVSFGVRHEHCLSL